MYQWPLPSTQCVQENTWILGLQTSPESGLQYEFVLRSINVCSSQAVSATVMTIGVFLKETKGHSFESICGTFFKFFSSQSGAYFSLIIE